MDSSIPNAENARLFQTADGIKHRTDKFQPKNGTCYLRRGQSFHVAIQFQGSFDPCVHRLQLFFYTGDRYRSLYTSSDLVQVLEPSNDYKWPPPSTHWGAKRVHMNKDTVCVEVVSPTWLPIGSWRMEVFTDLVNAPGIQPNLLVYRGTIYFLFNPWNPEDDTYMPDEHQLDQYVLNDVGHVWQMYNPSFWDFGQFEECVLPAFELLMKHDGLPHHRRGDPVIVSRAIARIVNYGLNRAGIMIGRWDGNYADGINPSHWRGSAVILQKYLNGGGAPVKYGQCWVFAGLCVTICRALGMPARLVTTVGAAHDYDENFTIDDTYNEQLELVRGETLWNYHCWIDAWMRRRDIGKNEYNGWQAVDGTPQHVSDWHYQLGPTPLKAIKEGDMNVNYDARYMFQEVNGDYARWLQYRDRSTRLIDLDTKRVGTGIFTDDPYSIHEPKILSIMDMYKYPEGTAQERQAMYRAISSNQHLSRLRNKLENHLKSNDVSFEGVHPSVVRFGDDIDLSLKITNISDQVRTMQYELILDVVDNSNHLYHSIKSSNRLRLTMKPNERHIRSMRVSSLEYVHKLLENCLLRYRVKCWVTETGQPWLYQGYVYLEFPKIFIHFAEPLSVTKSSYVHFNFDRPVNYRLTNCKLMIGGSCFGRELPDINLNDVPGGVQFVHRVSVQPARSGKQKVTVKFTSQEIPQVENWIEVNVQGPITGRSTRVLNFEEHMSEIIDNAFIDKTVLS